jgi:hypothetical protein
MMYQQRPDPYKTPPDNMAGFWLGLHYKPGFLWFLLGDIRAHERQVSNRPLMDLDTPLPEVPDAPLAVMKIFSPAVKS